MNAPASSIADMRAIDRQYLRARISGHHRQPREVDDAAERAKARYRTWIMAHHPADARRRLRRSRELLSAIKFLAKALPMIRRREVLQECVLAVLADYRTRTPSAALMRSIKCKRTASAVLFDMGVRHDVVAVGLGQSLSQTRNYASRHRKLDRSERVALRCDDAPAAGDELGHAWFCRELLSVIHAAQDIGAVHVANSGLDLLGVALDIGEVEYT